MYDLQSEDWNTTNPDDFLDSFLSLNDDFQFNELPTNLPSLDNQLSSVTSNDAEFHGFLDASSNGSNVSQGEVNFIEDNGVVLFNAVDNAAAVQPDYEQSPMSSSSSDSGLSSDNMEV